MLIWKLVFYTMTIRYFKAVTNSETRLAYGIPGPFLLIAAFISIFAGRTSPAVPITLFIAGTSSMRIQASMIEPCPWKSLRNGALLIIGFMVAFIFWSDENLVWSIAGLVVAAGLLVLHRQHEQMLKQRNGMQRLVDFAATQRSQPGSQ